jgi:hypothetical protein
MSWSQDLDTHTMVATGDHVRAVGWLSSDHPFTQGSVPAEFIARLLEFVRRAGESADALYFPAFGGFHTCEFCSEFHDSRNFGVPVGEQLYVAPGMVAHYVERHGYCPPGEFIAAVMAAPLPGTSEYQDAAADFRRRHQEWWEAFFKRQQGQAEQTVAPDGAGRHGSP